MGMELEMHVVPESALSAEWTGHDSREGFDRVVFGMHATEGCELLEQISAALGVELHFIKWPDGRAFEAHYDGSPVPIDEGIAFFASLARAIRERPDYPTRVSCWYQRDYLTAGKFADDVEAMRLRLEGSRANGATGFWLGVDATP